MVFTKNLIFIKGHVNFAKNDCDDAGEGMKKATICLILQIVAFLLILHSTKH